jgi:hypothetical protein
VNKILSVILVFVERHDEAAQFGGLAEILDLRRRTQILFVD